jgi:hypothetical protein
VSAQIHPLREHGGLLRTQERTHRRPWYLCSFGQFIDREAGTLERFSEKCCERLV